MNQSELKERLHYFPLSGVFIWKSRTVKRPYDNVLNGKYAGEIAGCTKHNKGYLIIGLDGRRYSAHRLVWLYTHGRFPTQIDHINGDKLDNRIENLREVDTATNNKNRPMQKNSKNECFGLTWREKRQRWEVTIENSYVGSFSDKNDAIKARKAAEKTNNYHPNHGRGIVAL